MSAAVTASPDMNDEAKLDAARRARVRRFGLVLLLVVVLIVLCTVGYVVLYPSLRDPNLPPSVKGPANRRVVAVELVLAALAAAGVTHWIVRRSRRSRGSSES
jgi:hypothetical protein